MLMIKQIVTFLLNTLGLPIVLLYFVGGAVIATFLFYYDATFTDEITEGGGREELIRHFITIFKNILEDF